MERPIAGPPMNRPLIIPPLPKDLEWIMHRYARLPGLKPRMKAEMMVPADGCDLTALCKFMTQLAPAKDPLAPPQPPLAEPYLTNLANSINLLKEAVGVIEAHLLAALTAASPGYKPYFCGPAAAGDPPEKGGTPPPPAFPPP